MEAAPVSGFFLFIILSRFFVSLNFAILELFQSCFLQQKMFAQQHFTIGSAARRFVPQTSFYDQKRIPIRSLIRFLGKKTYIVQLEQVIERQTDGLSPVENYVVSFTIILRKWFVFNRVVEQSVHGHDFHLQQQFDKEGAGFDRKMLEHISEYTYQDLNNLYEFYCHEVIKTVDLLDRRIENQ